ncbi:MAG TPA: hypothetical protein VGK78_02895 [Nocardioides sp.]|uniref:hypothetical protein n=1 Tax=Nocardioides sp. TaxID=35761 RepID=UPI002F40BE98
MPPLSALPSRSSTRSSTRSSIRSGTPSGTRSGPRSASAVAAVLVALALAAGGCSSSTDSSAPQAGPSSSSSTNVGGARPVESKVLLGRVAGNLHQPNRKIFQKHRKRVLKRVGAAVDTWIDGGFVGVDYPRKHFKSAFAAFTGPARHDARRQLKLLTNWSLRRKIDGVHVRKRTVIVDVLAPHGRPAGATARVLLVFKTTGHRKLVVTVSGRLFLIPDGHGGWRIFGYDVSQGGK